MSKNPLILIDHILDCIYLIEKHLDRFKKYDFFDEIWLQDMIVHRIQIMGEAAKNVPQAIKEKNPKVNWKNIGGTRDILVHAYDSVNLSIIWDIVQRELKPLKKQMLKIKKDLEK